MSASSSTPGPLRRLARRALRLLLALVIVLGGLYLGRRALLTEVGNVFVRDDADGAKADVAVLLLGDPTPHRADRAIALWRSGAVKKILLAQVDAWGWAKTGLIKDDTQVHYDYLRQQGVPDDAINVLRGCLVGSTFDEAFCMRDYLIKAPPAERVARVTVVTSWYHSARAAWTFRKVFADSGIALSTSAATAEGSSPATWWESEATFLAVFEEALKWPYNYLTNGHRAPSAAPAPAPVTP